MVGKAAPLARVPSAVDDCTAGLLGRAEGGRVVETARRSTYVP
ncbi:hypothetical protein AB0L74_14095 [Streptomyces sp. NPDC052020]